MMRVDDGGGDAIVYILLDPAAGDGGRCVKETTGWSQCSVSCGFGWSVRLTNDNDDCLSVQERRLCIVRTCLLNDKHLVQQEHLHHLHHHQHHHRRRRRRHHHHHHHHH